ncbi:MAG: DUF1178 family protein [Erythrobacter sp.]|jgi:hypothetical protein
MIVFNLSCSEGHRFEGWFGSSADFADQQARGLVSCPQCGCGEVAKAPMAPAVPAKGNSRSGQAIPTQMVRGEMPAQVKQALKALAEAQARALKSSTWVGDSFAEKARAMHYGETDESPIHGQATRDEAAELHSEGIAVAPLLFPVAPPDELN